MQESDKNETNLEKMAYRDKNFYERMGCEVLYGKKAAQIDPSTKQIALNDDTVIPYDKLCIATGSSPFVPPLRVWNQWNRSIPL